MRPLTLLAMTALLGGCVPAPDVDPDPVAEQRDDPPREQGVPDGAVADRVKWLIAHIDDDPDFLHFDYTPAVHHLIDIGEPAVLPALDLMLTGDEHTRPRAANVVAGVTLAQHGFVRGQGWAAKDGEQAWRRLWAEMGSYDSHAPEEQRRASVALWKKRHERTAGE